MAMTAIEQAAIELHTILWENVGDTGDWPIRIEYDDGDEEVAERFCQALNSLGLRSRKSIPSTLPGRW